MIEFQNLSSNTVVFVYSIVLEGDTEKLSGYKVSYRIPSLDHQFSKNYEIKKNAVHFGESSKFSINGQFPQMFDFQLVLTKSSAQIMTKPLIVQVKNNNFNKLTKINLQLDEISSNRLTCSVTIYIRAKLYNTLYLDNYPIFKISLDDCKVLSTNVYAFNDDLIIKRIGSNYSGNLYDNSMREILPLFELPCHDNIIKLKGYLYIDDEPYLVLEKYGESLDKLIHKKKLKNEMITKIIVCVCCGLIHMHRYNYIHRDIKPGNIVVSENGEAKLIDFGISRPIIENDLMSEIGTRGYIAPELNSDSYDFNADTYSFGAVILRMVSDISINDFYENKVELNNIHQITQGVIRSMLSNDSLKRPQLPEILYLIVNCIFYFEQDKNNQDDLFNLPAVKTEFNYKTSIIRERLGFLIDNRFLFDPSDKDIPLKTKSTAFLKNIITVSKKFHITYINSKELEKQYCPDGTLKSVSVFIIIYPINDFLNSQDQKKFNKLRKTGKFKEIRKTFFEMHINNSQMLNIMDYLLLIDDGKCDSPVSLSLITGLCLLHGCRFEKKKNYGINLITAEALDNKYAKYELGMLYLHGIYIKQDIKLAMHYLSQLSSIHEIPFSDFQAGFYYFPKKFDFYVDMLILEMQLCKDFSPIYDRSYQFGLFKQNTYLYQNLSELHNPLAMYCYAHMMKYVNSTIFWLEQASEYGLDISFNEIAYLSFVYLKNIDMAMHYSETGAFLGFYESQLIYSIILKSKNNYEYQFWEKHKKKVKKINELVYPYEFEKNDEENIIDFRLNSIKHFGDMVLN